MRPKILIALLLLMSALACTLTAQVTPTPQDSGRGALIAQTVRPTKQPEPPALPQTITPAPVTCQVKTGIDQGVLNLRACGGISCPVLDVIHEGEKLTVSETRDGWLAVKTAGGLSGWINSQFTDCEVTK